MMNKKHLLVTGATGYIGGYLVKLLLSNNFVVHLLIRKNSQLDSKLRTHENVFVHEYTGEYQSIDAVFSKETIFAVFHLAACGSHQHDAKLIRNMIAANIELGSFILEAMQKHSCKYFINTGSYWQHGVTSEYAPMCYYAATKQAFEDIIDFFVRDENICAITLKLYDVYGRNDSRNKLLNSLSSIIDSEEIFQMSPGEQKLNLVHVDDVCVAFLQAYQLITTMPAKKHQRYFVGSCHLFSIRELVAVYEKKLNTKLKLEWGALPYRKHQIMQPYCGPMLPNWQPMIPLEQGLQQLIDEAKTL